MRGNRTTSPTLSEAADALDRGRGRTANADPVKLGNISPLLIVEDNYLAALDLMRFLEEWSIEARSVPRLPAARELAVAMRPKVALIDINLEGGFEGVAFARELQALYRTKIVFVTGYNVRDLMHRMDGADNMAVLSKPVERDVLATVLSQVSTTIEAAH